MKGAYMLIHLGVVLFPLILSFDKRVRYHKKWKFLFPGLVITGGFFLVWDLIFTLSGVWSFNPQYVLGVHLYGLPVEEMLFFLTVPFACVFIHECLLYYVKRDFLQKSSSLITGILMVYSVLMVVLFYDRIYTLVNFAFLLAILLYVAIKRPPFMGRFYLSYGVSLLPFYIVNGYLTSIPIVLYNNAENMGWRVGTIPLEDHFYSLSLFLMNILFFEKYKERNLQ